LLTLRVCPVGTATAIACTVQPPEEARHATHMKEPALCAYASYLGRETLLMPTATLRALRSSSVAGTVLV